VNGVPKPWPLRIRLMYLMAGCWITHRTACWCRRAKNVLLTAAVEALQKKIKKGKGVNKSVIAQRETKVGAPC
jgi:hypothetical protein